MSREIKFRAWCKTESWHNGERKEKYFMENDIEEINLEPTENDPQGEFIGKLGIWCGIHESILMQYIGVNDKNRKEIYEGDIIKRKMFDDYIIGKVVYLDIGFCGIMLKCGSNYYHIGKSEHTGISDCDEVIGNVHENADLLKEAGNE